MTDSSREGLSPRGRGNRATHPERGAAPGKPPATGESKSLAWGPLPVSIVLDSAGDDAQGVPVRHTTRFIDSSELPMPMACARVDWFAELT